MNHEVHNIDDDVLFDRLVDGELSTDERQQLLASLDDRADGWRRCALAFLEAQSWRTQLRQVVAEPSSTTRPASLVQGSLPAPKRRTSPAASAAWLTVAAGLLVAFGLGWRMNAPDATDAVQLAIDSPTAPLVQDEASLADAPLPDDDAITLVVQDHQGVPRRVRVPLVEGSRLGEQFAASPQWAAPAVREQFAQQGLDLQARRRYAPLFFEQKDRVVPMIVPVDDAVITPVSRPIY